MIPNALPKTINTYLNKSMFLFGATDTGKSTILFEIMHILKDVVPVVFVFSPTADQNNAFKGIVPKEAIYTSVDMDIITQIYKRQEVITRLYTSANDFAVVSGLVARLKHPGLQKLESLVYARTEEAIANLNSNPRRSPGEKEMIEREMRQTCNKELCRLYKNAIKLFAEKLLKMDLTIAEKIAIKFVDLSPYCWVIFDDCGAELAQFQEHPYMKKILYMGRHSYISTVVLLQDDSNVESSLKKNIKLTIFTTAQCAYAYFERKNNNFPAPERKRAAAAIGAIFSSVGGTKNHRKMVYVRDDNDPYRSIIADIHPPFKFGDPHLHKLCEELHGGDEKKESDGAELSEFVADI